jgi:hypothetical protein
MGKVKGHWKTLICFMPGTEHQFAADVFLNSEPASKAISN